MTDRLYDLLVRRLSEEKMPAGTPVAVAELHRRLVPYPLARSELGLAAKTEYDLALLRLLGDAERVELEETALREAIGAELRSAEPGLAFLHRFAASPVRVRRGGRPTVPSASDADAGSGETDAGSGQTEVGSGGTEAGEDGPDGVAPRRAPPRTAAEGERMAEELLPGLEEPAHRPRAEVELPPKGAGAGRAPAAPRASGDADAACRACGRPLPDRPGVRFCPACGADQQSWPCPACGETVERGWRYCAHCGAPQGG
jgi:hypothetical protein